MQTTDRSLDSIVNKEALSYAMYTIENRAIPNMIDGFKPVQRFILHRTIQMSKGNRDKMHKLASVAGGVADLGYLHGEVSAQDAAALMANNWNNNFPFLDGQGNFGSRLVQEAAASRYIFCRLSKNFDAVFKDLEICPVHEDEEHIPPKFYLPVIPTVLLNGVKGIATGYATSILPHDMSSVIASTKAAILGEKIPEPSVHYPLFNGKIVQTDIDKFELHGIYKFTSKTQMYISEIPYQWDRAKYIEKVLDPLEDAGFITYDDDCSKDGFGFKIKFRKDYILPTDPEKLDDKIKKDFKLIEKVSQNIVVINEHGKLNDTFKTAGELIEAFVKVRFGYVEGRIDHMIKKCDQQYKTALAKALFINKVNSNDLVIKGKKRAELKAELSDFTVQNQHIFRGHEDTLLSMNVYHMTQDEAQALTEKAKQAKADLVYWQNTDAKTEYLKDIELLEKI